MRIGINVPDELLEEFKPLKNTLNLSQICRDAIKNRIDSYERAVSQARQDGMEDVAARLWRDYAKRMIIDWEAMGRQDAKVWANLATLEDFEGTMHNLEVCTKRGAPPDAYMWYCQMPGSKRFEDHHAEYVEWIDQQCKLDSNSDPTQAKSQYYQGWFSYITAVWQMVKDRVASDAAKRETARQQTKDKPEIPDHLTKELSS